MFRILNNMVILNSASFQGTNIAEIRIPSTLELICGRSFELCKSLRLVSFDKDSRLREIGEHAFAGCAALQSIELPSSLERIKADAFAESGLYELKLPENILNWGQVHFEIVGICTQFLSQEINYDRSRTMCLMVASLCKMLRYQSGFKRFATKRFSDAWRFNR